MSDSEITITLTTLAYGGDAMGRLEDGRVAFIPFTLPGEIVRARILEEKRGYVRAELLEILEASPRRIQPACVHFQNCGGCNYQHMAYPDQLLAKTAILKDQLIRIGKLVDPSINQMISSPEPLKYRNYAQFHLDSQGKIGYKGAGSDRVVVIQECCLLKEEIGQTWPLLDFENLPDIERIGLRVGVGEDLQLILESQEPYPPEFMVEGLPLSAVHLSPAGSLVLAGSEAIYFDVKGRLFRVSASSFFQVNPGIVGLLIDGLLEGLARHARLTLEATILDVYCGVGLFSAFLAPNCGRLIGIESSASAVEDFTENLGDFDHVEIYESSAGQALESLNLDPPEVVVVDPPRSGLERPVIDALLRLKPEILAYISCDPSTLSRDARRLVEGGYHLIEITPYDMFPQTYHVESLSFWAG